MKNWPSYAILAAALAFLALVPAIRSCGQEKMENPVFHAALYWGHIGVIDSDTKEHIDFNVVWDDEGVSLFSKGSGPAVVETLSDGSKVIMIVGRFSEAPLRISCRASGYHTKTVDLSADRGGISKRSQDQAMKIVALERIGVPER